MRSLKRIVSVLPLILAGLPAPADTPFTATNWISGVPVPGIQCTNSSGQAYLKGNVHVLRVLADDARIMGRMQAGMDLAYQTNGASVCAGPAYLEVGTWDTAGPTFTPSGGVWDLKYTGVAQPDGSGQIDMIGYGIGGAVDGLRMEAIATKGPGAPFDPAIPYFASGTIKPAPVNSSVLVDDFEDGDWRAWDDPGAGTGMPVISENGGHLIIRCDWTGVRTINPVNTMAWVGHSRAWTVSGAQTVELRADLVALNSAADGAILAFAVQEGGPNYVLLTGHGWVLLFKQSGAAMAALCGGRVAIPESGVVMSLALTGSGQNLVLTARIFDKAAPNNPLYERAYLDTPVPDAVLSPQNIADVMGASVPGLGSEPGVAFKTGQRVWLGVWQNTDGSKPAAEATFDNVLLHTYAVPQISIEPAVRLTWPSTGMNFGVEVAPTPQGPWLPAPDLEIPGVQSITLPTSERAQFYRPR